MPTTLVALTVTVLAVLPGAAYTWAFERQASAYGVSFADRTLRLIATSLIFHLLLGWPEFLVYRQSLVGHPLDVTGFGTLWTAALVLMAAPATAGTVLGGLYATRVSRDGWSWSRARLSDSQEARLPETFLGKTPAPRAWDDLFSDRPSTYVRVRTASGDWLAGRFADRSYAGGFPHESDLLLEEAWAVSEGDPVVLERPLGYALYVPAEQIAWLELIPEEDRDGER